MLKGRVVLVTGGDQAVGAGLVSALRASGASVGEVVTASDDRAATFAAVAAAVDDVGPPHALVHARVEPAALEPRRLIDVDDERWASVWETTMRSMLWLCQAVHPHLAGRDGRVVVVLPTLAMAGAAELAPWAAAAEGQRLLVKSAARQWGADGITVNCVTPDATLLGLDPEASGEMALSAPALGSIGDPEADIGPIVAFLCSTASHFLTGATLSVDGGSWLA